MVINIDDLIKEIEDFKSVAILGHPVLVELFSNSAEEISKEYKKNDWLPVAKLLGIKTSGKELEVISRMIEAYNKLV